ncbi:Mlp family lipoprotein (plasmid) [Borrelia miyamotoi]|uniref:Mlp family lipoprotein n=1 Tax=Borrelia miyamotoi TaxID=47466 RepID=A0A482CXG0_9SPIR|nr:Mlp family lipoprotein [Borrelia miyamotoi]ATQ19159.1 Mlp family lipoprotein [Borrelia miyamotoi]QBK62695.1 Mlp family lipoprotein [Borrelia miyamotoi]QBK63952.1 Mlp family lipoprotein [Borrelia miyamotoi]QBK65222.1 Mlp family lipoprotein [Borrelia miyamotoi]QBK66485.1 Mlp family lipoprotein [Borrelia miyamotoi]
MRRISCILLLLVLISSCGQNDFTTNVETKSRGKRELSEEQVVVKKAPEEILRERLSEEEKRNLDFLKEALGDNGKFNQFVLLNENKVKDALKHINDELAKCTGDNASEQKGTFKTVVQGYFSKMDESTLDGFKDGATSTCEAGAGS